MYYKYRGLNIAYDVLGKGNPIILLHGWGTSKNTFTSLKEELSKSYEVHALDLIGFGKSDEPFKPYSLNDYILFLRDYIKNKNIINPIILGHSFGGRIAIKYTSIFKDVSKLILVDSAGIRRINLSNKFKILKYKVLKKWYKLTSNKKMYNLLINNSGSYDYKLSSSVMKQTLSLIVNENLNKHIKKIKTTTLIIWGKNDKVTPYKDALYLKKHIKESKLVSFENTGHFPYLENKEDFNKVVKEFLEVNYDLS